MNKNFLNSIKPGILIDYDFCMKIYAHDITFPGSAELALDKIEKLGLEGIRDYYKQQVEKYENKHREEMKGVAEWYKKKCQEEYERQARKKNGAETRPGYQFTGFPEDW